jgi:hypothetical protein
LKERKGTVVKKQNTLKGKEVRSDKADDLEAMNPIAAKVKMIAPPRRG